MIRVSLTNAFSKRTLKPLLEKHQATPLGINLLSTVTDDIYSGYAAALTTEAGGTTGVVRPFSDADGDTEVFGLFALDKNAVINDLDGQPADLKPFAVWQGGPDAYFRIDTPAWAVDGGTVAVGAYLTASSAVKGLLVPSDGANTVGPNVAEITEVVSSDRLVVRLSAPAV